MLEISKEKMKANILEKHSCFGENHRKSFLRIFFDAGEVVWFIFEKNQVKNEIFLASFTLCILLAEKRWKTVMEFVKRDGFSLRSIHDELQKEKKNNIRAVKNKNRSEAWEIVPLENTKIWRNVLRKYLNKKVQSWIKHQMTYAKVQQL